MGRYTEFTHEAYSALMEGEFPFWICGIEFGPGWYDIVYDMCVEMKKTKPHEDFRLTQVKEKFGTLRVYGNYMNDAAFAIEQKYEDISSRTCEHCGEPGRVEKINGWYTALCPRCKKEREEKLSRS